MTWPLTPWDYQKDALSPEAAQQVQDHYARRYLAERTFGQPERRARMLVKLPPVKRDPARKPWPTPWRRRNAGGAERRDR